MQAGNEDNEKDKLERASQRAAVHGTGTCVCCLVPFVRPPNEGKKWTKINQHSNQPKQYSERSERV